MTRTLRALSPSLALLLALAAAPAFATGPALLHPVNTPEFVTLPYFDWDDFVPSPFGGSYEIQIDDDALFGSPVVSATVPALISFYSPHQELPTGTYYWRVRYRPDSGASSDWSSSQFTLGATANVFTVPASPTWQDVKDTLQDAFTYGDQHAGSSSRFVFLPEKGTSS